ncbi:serine/threonine-protein kinase [Amycolatopsis cynarae]|uniref:Serine/threonine-protein kinase n=1 Tax=Amycolatopsis cynarae TaxID=2995223 RepID=A0ABY7BAC7_9PSEU|nr:serine/threonine-protein kinase [Amycolatopsis sp. HUAS 11-8]WAL68083.1 serine/threonine-protein kinase [Amycolatopsis sp. HUAS 11-8]
MEPLGAGDPVRISGYRLEGRLGAGGMGQVYLGTSADGRQVAVKVIRRELVDDPEFLVRFRREVAARMAVSGRHSVPVVGADPDGDPPWLASVYVPAPSLAEAVADRGPLPEAEVLRLAAGLAEALKTIHEAGLTHRDLKPGNILLAEDGPRVIDFGLAVSVDNTALTRTNMVIGTPGYLAPERIKGEEVGPASDVYSLGAVLTFAATGRAPHGDGSFATLVYRILSQEPDLAGIHGVLRRVVSACLATEPTLRPGPEGILRMLAGETVPPPVKPTAKNPPAKNPPTKKMAGPGERRPIRWAVVRRRLVKGFWLLVGTAVLATIAVLVWHSVRIEYHLFGKDDAARYLGVSPGTVFETEESITPDGNHFAHSYQWNPIGDGERSVLYRIHEYEDADAAGSKVRLPPGASLVPLPNGSNAVIQSGSTGCVLQLQNDDLLIEVYFTLDTAKGDKCAPAHDAARLLDERLGEFP